MTTNGATLSATGVHKAFGDNEVLKGVSLSVSRGEVVTLIGASGSGKSTFLRCLNLLEMPQQGQLAVGDLAFEFGRGRRPPGDAQLALLRRSVGMVFQHFNLFPHMSVLGNVTEGPVQVKGSGAGGGECIGARPACEGRPRRQGGCVSQPVVRRPEAARGDCACARHEARGDAVRRADLGA